MSLIVAKVNALLLLDHFRKELVPTPDFGAQGLGLGEKLCTQDYDTLFLLLARGGRVGANFGDTVAMPLRQVKLLLEQPSPLQPLLDLLLTVVAQGNGTNLGNLRHAA